MAVRFRNFLQYGGGSPLATSFSDAFQRADTLQGLGPNYLGMPRSSLQSVAALPSCRVSENQLQCYHDGAAGGSQVPGVVFLPVPLLNTAVYGQAQFAQATWFSSAGADMDTGPAVMFSGDFASQNQAGYQMEFDSPNIVLNLLTTSRIELGAAAYTPAGGDVWRIEARPGSLANAVSVKINGVTVISVDDANPARPVNTGYPCFWNWAASNTVLTVTIFTAFSAGIL